LSGADLKDSDLAEADLTRANVQGVNFDNADLRGANLAGFVNWDRIRSIKLANIEGIRNPPDGFIRFAQEHGAVALVSTEQWNDLIRQSPTSAK
jgi:uncharacterized protein YjbI with pentapeptide repeats